MTRPIQVALGVAITVSSGALVGQGGPVFVPNHGQWEEASEYRLRVGRSAYSFESAGWAMTFGDGALCATARQVFENATGDEIRPGERLAGVHHYFVGADAARWRTHVPRYDSVGYPSLYDGIDVRAYVTDGHFEYDLVLQPGADLDAVEVRIEGVGGFEIGASGALVFETAVGPVRMTPPRTWEVDARGQRRDVASRYVRRGTDTFGFEVRGWDGDTELVLDPGVLYSTLVGGDGMDLMREVDVEDGIRTVVGQSWSTNFPTTSGAFGAGVTTPFRYDVIVASLDTDLPAAQQLQYATYLGGGEDENPVFVSVDGGVVTIAGTTGSRAPTVPAFPVTGSAFAPKVPATASVGDNIFVARLDPSLSGAAQLVYATCFGGDGDEAMAAAVDAAGRIAVTGTATPGYPTTANAFQGVHAGTSPSIEDAFVAVIDPSLPTSQQFVYSTFLGQELFDEGRGVTFADGGVLTVVGMTTGNGFPTSSNAFDATYNQGGDGFLTQLDPAQPPASQLVYSTFLGGSGGLEIDQIDDVHVAGSIVTTAGLSSSNVFPTTTGAFCPTCSGFFDTFVARFDLSLPAEQQLIYSTCLGGLNTPVEDMVVEPDGVVTLTGHSIQAAMPTTPGAYWRTPGTGGQGYIVRLDPDRPAAQQLLYGTFVPGDPTTRGLHCDEDGTWTLVADTTSGLYPVTPGAWNNLFFGGLEGALTLFDLLPTGATRFGEATAGCGGKPIAGVTAMPELGSSTFTITCSKAPASASGVLLLAASGLGTGVPVAGIELWVDPTPPGPLGLPVASDPAGSCDVPLPLIGSPSLVGLSLHGQFVWAEVPAPCAPTGLSASSGLRITIQ